jgi:hypothetical protein
MPHLLQLQRAAGNRAVSWLLSKQGTVVQRAGGGMAGTLPGGAQQRIEAAKAVRTVKAYATAGQSSERSAPPSPEQVTAEQPAALTAAEASPNVPTTIDHLPILETVNAEARHIPADPVIEASSCGLAGRDASASRDGQRFFASEPAHVVQRAMTWQSGRQSFGMSADSALGAPTRSSVAGSAPDPVLQRTPVTNFSDANVLVAAVVKDSPKQEDLAGACNFLNNLPMTRMLRLARQIGARRPTAVGALQQVALTSRVRIALAAVKLQGEISRVGFAIDRESDLKDLPKPDANQVLDVLGPVVPELAAMQKTKGFQALRADEQTRLIYLIGGSTSLSERAPAALRAVLADRRANKEDPATFRKFLADEKYLGSLVRLPRGKARAAYPFTVGTARFENTHLFGGEVRRIASAAVFDVVIEGKDPTGKAVKQMIPVFTPWGSDLDRVQERFGLPTIDEIATTLATIPDVSRIKIVHVDVHRLPADDRAPGGGEAYADAGDDGILNFYPTRGGRQDTRKQKADQIVPSVIHETGHTASLAAWGEDHYGKHWETWRAAIISDGLAPSQYGREDIDDDFAESWALYIPAVGTPREKEVRGLMPARCKLMDSLLSQLPLTPASKSK